MTQINDRSSVHLSVSNRNLNKSWNKSNINDLFQLTEKFSDLQIDKLNLDELKFVYSVPQVVDPEPLTCIIQPSEDLGGLYLGGYSAASDVDLLRSHKIRAVLTASIETGLKYPEESIHFHEIIEAHDNSQYDITQHFDQAYEFIERNRKYTNVLVHCYLGISRSASLIVAYLMKKQNIKLEKALWSIKAKRRQVNPNIGFMRQLEVFEKKLTAKQMNESQISMSTQQQFNTFPKYQYAQPAQIQQQTQKRWNPNLMESNGLNPQNSVLKNENQSFINSPSKAQPQVMQYSPSQTHISQKMLVYGHSNEQQKRMNFRPQSIYQNNQLQRQ